VHAPYAGPYAGRTANRYHHTRNFDYSGYHSHHGMCARRLPTAYGPSRPDSRVRSLFLECSVRLPGYGRTGTPVNDVEDYPLVVD